MSPSPHAADKIQKKSYVHNFNRRRWINHNNTYDCMIINSNKNGYLKKYMTRLLGQRTTIETGDIMSS